MDELKRIKHVVQYGIFAAYHLALETSFLADEGATLPELPLRSPLTVTLPDKRSTADSSISTVPGFTINTSNSQQATASFEHLDTDSVISADPSATAVVEPPVDIVCLTSQKANPCSFGPLCTNGCNFNSRNGDKLEVTATADSVSMSSIATSDVPMDHSHIYSTVEKRSVYSGDYHEDYSRSSDLKLVRADSINSNHHQSMSVVSTNTTNYSNLKEPLEGSSALPNVRIINTNNLLLVQPVSTPAVQNQENSHGHDVTSNREDVVPSDHQSILVSLSIRCVWKRSICERAHLLRIKYYGNADKPLGRFLRDQLFEKVFILFIPCMCNFMNFGLPILHMYDSSNNDLYRITSAEHVIRHLKLMSNATLITRGV
jgi:1-phosphatidylinositol-3-phosphate 5-kinase